MITENVRGKLCKMSGAGARALKSGRAGGLGRGIELAPATVLSGEVREINAPANVTYGGMVSCAEN
jgi:hypothetical protein